jgi:hypothetical protein
LRHFCQSPAFGAEYGKKALFSMGLRIFVDLALLIPLAHAGVPDVDRRQVNLAGVKTHFKMPEFASRK